MKREKEERGVSQIERGGKFALLVDMFRLSTTLRLSSVFRPGLKGVYFYLLVSLSPVKRNSRRVFRVPLIKMSILPASLRREPASTKTRKRKAFF